MQVKLPVNRFLKFPWNSQGEAQQESRGKDQGEGYVSETEDQPASGDSDDGFSIQETPLVDIVFSHANSSRL